MRRAAARSLPQRVRGAWRTLLRAAHLISGAPDYERYLAHVRAAHPGTTPLSRDEFVRDRLESRYAKPGGKCC